MDDFVCSILQFGYHEKTRNILYQSGRLTDLSDSAFSDLLRTMDKVKELIKHERDEDLRAMRSSNK
jgi:hypothetical protein